MVKFHGKAKFKRPFSMWGAVYYGVMSLTSTPDTVKLKSFVSGKVRTEDGQSPENICEAEWRYFPDEKLFEIILTPCDDFQDKIPVTLSINRHTVEVEVPLAQET